MIVPCQCNVIQISLQYIIHVFCCWGVGGGVNDSRVNHTLPLPIHILFKEKIKRTPIFAKNIL